MSAIWLWNVCEPAQIRPPAKPHPYSYKTSLSGLAPEPDSMVFMTRIWLKCSTSPWTNVEGHVTRIGPVDIEAAKSSIRCSFKQNTQRPGRLY